MLKMGNPPGGSRIEQKKAERFHLSLSLFVPSFNSFENIINFTKIHSGKGNIYGAGFWHFVKRHTNIILYTSLLRAPYSVKVAGPDLEFRVREWGMENWISGYNWEPNCGFWGLPISGHL